MLRTRKILHTLFIITTSILFLFLLSSCSAYSKSDAAVHVDRLIENIGEITLDSESKLQEIDDAIAALSDHDYQQLENLDLLGEKQSEFDALKAATLDGLDKIAFDFIVQSLSYLSSTFTSPSSIRISSGSVRERIIRENPYYAERAANLILSGIDESGKVITAYYNFSSEGGADAPINAAGPVTIITSSTVYLATDCINISRVNNALEKYFNGG